MRLDAYCKKLPKAFRHLQILSLRPAFRSAVSLTEPTAGFYFTGFSVLSAVCPLFANIAFGALCALFVLQKNERTVHSLGYSRLCRLEHMGIHIQSIQPLKRTHNSKIFWSRSVKRFSLFCPLQGTFCVATVFRAACSRCGSRAVGLWRIRLLWCTRSAPSTSRG